MIIDVKYDIGDKVKYVYREQHRILEKCGCCGGNKAIIGLDYKEYRCPKCDGTGCIYIGHMEHEEVREGVVWGVEVEYRSVRDKRPIINYNMPHKISQDDVIEVIERAEKEEEK